MITFLYVLLALVLLGILITVHEFGHFFAARLTGIAVKEFSIGFGPTILKWKSKKHETQFSLRPIPMGGYCMFYGDTDDDPKGENKDDPRNYNNAPVWKRMLSVICGPLMNFVLAFVVAAGVMTYHAITPAQPYVQTVESGMPAAEAGLLPGDMITSVGGTGLEGASVQEITAAIGALTASNPTDFTVMRDGEEVSLTITPELNEEESRYYIGITLVGPIPASRIIPGAWDTCVYAAGAILNSLGNLVTTGEGLDDMAGPVGVVHLVAEQTRTGGFSIFLNLMIIISVNLGLINLFPIPGLDGSRLVFMLIEAIRRKPVSQRVESAIHLGGYALLFGLMIVFTFRDVGRIIGL